MRGGRRPPPAQDSPPQEPVPIPPAVDPERTHPAHPMHPEKPDKKPKKEKE